MCFIQAIVYMLVNKVMEQMTATVVEELFNDQAVVEMLAEDPGITKKREETQQAIVYLDEAIEKINYMLEMRASGRNKVQDYADKFGVQFFPGEKPWGQKVDIIMPCATQNDVDLEQAKRIVANNIKYYIEVANMPTTNEALKYLMEQPNMIVAPSKAVNAGGVLVSGLEMSQNSERYSWTAEEVDSKLHQIMTGIHDGSAAAAEKYGLGYNLVAGANIVGFQKVADAMMTQGIAW